MRTLAGEMSKERNQEDRNKKFEIEFQGLKEGVHLFELEVDKEFLSMHSLEGIEDIEGMMDLELEKKSTLMELNFDFKGWVRVVCDRCGDMFRLPLQFDSYLLVKFNADKDESSSEEIIVLSPSDHKLQLGHYIYETISVSLPMKKVHEENMCDPEALSKLEKLDKKDDQVDERWNDLKEFFDN